MEFGFSDKELAFREEIEAFLKEELSPDWPERSGHWPGGYGTIEFQDPQLLSIAKGFRRKPAEKGWLTIAWPKEYGGESHSYMQQAIFEERSGRVAFHYLPGCMEDCRRTALQHGSRHG
jgi:alkylation response protein AidB-like acyl-CoA dehydrogenase